MQQQGDYIDWYCSGIKNSEYDEKDRAQLNEQQLERYLEVERYVSESVVTDEIREDLFKLGWLVVKDSDQA
jgi:hypothetical protein